MDNIQTGLDLTESRNLLNYSGPVADDNICESESKSKHYKAVTKIQNIIPILVYKQTDDEEIKHIIRESRDEGEPEPEEEAEEPEEEKSTRRTHRRGSGKSDRKGRRVKKKDYCPQGGTFGDDFEEFDECDNCDNWNPCEAQYNKELP